MSYALVINNAVTAEQGALPDSARRLDTQQWVLGLPAAGVTLQHACGWYAVTDVAKPADTPTVTTDRSLTLVAGVPTVTWTSRPKTQAEIDSATAAANQATIQTQAQGALATNTTALGLPDPTPGNTTYLAIGSPTNVQVTAQVRALTQQNNALSAQVVALTQQNNKLIRLALGLFDSTS